MRTQQRLIGTAAAALLAVALVGPVRAEGGLPGSPRAVSALQAADAVQLPQPAIEAAAATAGGAALSPFADRADAMRAAATANLDGDNAAGMPDLSLTAWIGLLGLGAFGWLARLALR
ncbi:hypothetical protein [Variovorax sp. KK3]|uniref:hypothetical protein n=1 Tax=Variovorax sp. KK3 TaxID=1855728 RepID=UPI00117D1EE6|nr:hypothetical protein [Variovorax sp. KK3]